MRTLSFLPALMAVLVMLGLFVFLVTKTLIFIFPVLAEYIWWIFGIWFFLIFLFPLSMIFGNFTHSKIFHFTYEIGGIATGAALLTFFITLPVLFFVKFFPNYSAYFQIFSIIAILLINIYGLYAGYMPKFVNYSLDFQKPHNFHNKKFVLLADTHYGYIFGENAARNLVTKINEIQPEFVLIAGDFFDGPWIENYGDIAKIFNNVESPVFYANGNHEEYANTDMILKAIGDSKIQILNNKIIDFQGIQIAGVSYHDNKKANDFTKILEQIRPNPNSPSILMKHEPTEHEISEKFGFDLMVSGHTHHGQMWPFILITDKIYGKYSHGISKDTTQWAITSGGVGNW